MDISTLVNSQNGSIKFLKDGQNKGVCNTALALKIAEKPPKSIKIKVNDPTSQKGDLIQQSLCPKLGLGLPTMISIDFLFGLSLSSSSSLDSASFKAESSSRRTWTNRSAFSKSFPVR